jgi:hypothetical protein
MWATSPVAVRPAGAFSASRRPARVLRTRVAHQQGAARTGSAHASQARRCPRQRRRSEWLQPKSTQVPAGTSRLLPNPSLSNFVPFQFLLSTMPPQNSPGGHAAPAMPCVTHSKGLTCGRRGPHMPPAGNEGRWPPISDLSNLRSWLTGPRAPAEDDVAESQKAGRVSARTPIRARYFAYGNSHAAGMPYPLHGAAYCIQGGAEAARFRP